MLRFAIGPTYDTLATARLKNRNGSYITLTQLSAKKSDSHGEFLTWVGTLAGVPRALLVTTDEWEAVCRR